MAEHSTICILIDLYCYFRFLHDSNAFLTGEIQNTFQCSFSLADLLVFIHEQNKIFLYADSNKLLKIDR